ncbi:multicopper oxidase family protein [Comamonadaceae bacterium PP-2]
MNTPSVFFSSDPSSAPDLERGHETARAIDLRRRALLIAPLGLTLPGLLQAQGMHGGHAGHGAPAGGAARPPSSGSRPAAARTLAPLDALPAGQPLAELVRLPNTSRRMGLFRARLTAQPVQVALMPGRTTTVWAYNGQVPGPLIDVREGDTVEIEFHNRLPQPSTVHWHGLPVPADQDGSPMDLVAPGARRLYRFTLPKGSAGTYWFHPHPHFMTAEQVFRGLAGAFIVRPADAADDPLAPLPERHLFVSDLKLAADGRIPDNTVLDWMNGREGQFALVNGGHRPRLAVAGPERWRIWNACSARYLRLSLGGLPFTQVGTDGGLLGQPLHGLTELLLSPAERAEIVVEPPAQGGRFDWVAEPYARGYMDMARMMGETERPAPASPRRVLASVSFAPASSTASARREGSTGTTGAETLPPPVVPATLRPIAALGEARVQRQVMFTESMDMEAMHGIDEHAEMRPQGMQFMVNGQLYDMDRIDFTAQRGEIEQWDIINASDMDHPFHIHGTQFQVVARVYDNQTLPEPVLAWRDTVNVRPAEIVRIRLVQDQPGLRMFHCHILEHEDLGMMGNLMVR